jgi:hypothetical protein
MSLQHAGDDSLKVCYDGSFIMEILCWTSPIVLCIDTHDDSGVGYAPSHLKTGVEPTPETSFVSDFL